ncbi:MAG TPA: Smr/MutS family protein [Pyrinomonadaceae bacterium]|nr:Smr/MutS family protein [Pyrinomonadaceae bacterium]
MGLLSSIRGMFSRPESSQTERQGEETAHNDDSFPDPFHPFPEPVAIPISDVFDLHTVRPQEVKPVVEEYLNEAARLGLVCVRIIHGKGIGVQREMVRSILARTSFVLDWSDAPPEAGGLGATIVRLKRPDVDQ